MRLLKHSGPGITRYRLSNSIPFGLGCEKSTGTSTPSTISAHSSIQSSMMSGYLQTYQELSCKLSWLPRAELACRSFRTAARAVCRRVSERCKLIQKECGKFHILGKLLGCALLTEPSVECRNSHLLVWLLSTPTCRWSGLCSGSFKLSCGKQTAQASGTIESEVSKGCLMKCTKVLVLRSLSYE